MIYFIQAGENGPVKIGYADDIRKRFSALQIGNHEELRLIGAAWGLATEERRLHGRFLDDHIRGEWFRPSKPILDYASRHQKGDIWAWANGRTNKRPKSYLEDFKDAEAQALAAIDGIVMPTQYKHCYGPRRKFSKGKTVAVG